MYKIEQLINAYLCKDNDSLSSTITLLDCLNKLDDPFSNASESYANELVQIWRPPWLKGIDWFE